MLRLLLSLAVALALAPATAPAAPRPAKSAVAPDSLFKASRFKGLELRSIGPAFNSGRVIDIAVRPDRPSTWYVAAASGGVWKTINAGTTWEPIFDDQGAYSIGCVTIDPDHPLTVWVGTGENNDQRSVAYGDGVHKSVDGGKHWTVVGLEHSEHIGKIVIDPRDPDVVYVAAQGPLWADGGDRGLYKTTDGGKTWKRVLFVDDRTGVTDVALDPRDPDVVFAAAWERHRHVWTVINGGPGSGFYKSTDGGATWQKLSNGLPKAEMGRIGFAISPVDPDVVYALIEARDHAGGVFRSRDGGVNWKRVSSYQSTSAQYYQELVCDPKDVNRVYSMDTRNQVSEDGGRTWRPLGEEYKHVDNHALWVDPRDTDHLIDGCDGGLYETFDRAKTWNFKANLPITQFYRVCTDNALPFYDVYGGTQDNNSLGGPSRTISQNGILNSDWFVTTGGDGFYSQADPGDPNIVYSESQHAGLVRFDRRSGERIGIQPQAGPADAPSRWNWNAPLLISPHSHTRLYLASQRLWRSDDRGDSWRPVSPDLTREIDRNRLPVAGRTWSVDAVAKNASTSLYGNIVSLDESPAQEGMLYVGTDDGLIQVSEDGGGHWRKVERFPGVPERTYVSRLTASHHDANVVYAAFDNHKNGDFKPYVLRSADRGRTWKSVAGNLPARGTVYCLAEDPGDPALLFAGTEFGLYFTVDGGRRWTRLQGGMPTIAVRDLAIQKRENDLVAATFGRGFYILDDYTPLRSVSADMLARPAWLGPVRTALMYIPSRPLGGREKANQGHAFFTAPNPPFGAVFTYHLGHGLETLEKKRQQREKAVERRGGNVFYPSWDSLRIEDRERAPEIVLTVKDADGHVVRRITGPVGAGFHRVAWDLRFPSSEPIQPGRERPSWRGPPTGPLAAPGTYTVSMASHVDGKVTPLGEPVRFDAVPLDNATLPAKDRAEVLAFQQKTARLQRAVLGAIQAAGEARMRIASLEKALVETPDAPPALGDTARALEGRLRDLMVSLTGDSVRIEHHEPAPLSIRQRVQEIVQSHWQSTAETPKTCREAYEIAGTEFAATLAKLRTLIGTDLVKLDAEAEAAGAPWTPGRLPEWRME